MSDVGAPAAVAPAAAGQWVEVSFILLTPGARAPGLPADTAQLPYEGRVRGFLLSDADIGGVARVKTLAGRHATGRLLEVLPRPNSFGPPSPELLQIGPELRVRLDEAGRT